jgi:hypothetical protein
MEVSKRKEYSAELKATMERASKGDATVMPALSAAFAEHPELVEVFGDMGKLAETALLNLATRSSLVAREAVTRQLRELREKLNAVAGSELERLLVTRVTLDWLSLQHAQIDMMNHLERSGTGPSVEAAHRRLDRAHARFLAATKTLASVAKLVRRAPSPLDFLRVQGDTAVPSSARDRSGRRFEATAAAN